MDEAENDAAQWGKCVCSKYRGRNSSKPHVGRLLIHPCWPPPLHGPAPNLHLQSDNMLREALALSRAAEEQN